MLTERKLFERVAAVGVLSPLLAIALMGHYMPDSEVRDNWRERLTEGCSGAPVVFNTSLSTYFLTRYYLPETHNIAWSGANDINLFLPDSVKEAMGIEQRRTPPPGLVCVLDLDTPISRQEERMFNAVLIHNAETSTVLSEVEELDIAVSANLVRFP